MWEHTATILQLLIWKLGMEIRPILGSDSDSYKNPFEKNGLVHGLQILGILAIWGFLDCGF